MFLDYRRAFEFPESPLYRWHKFSKDVIPLWVADMDFKTPPAVISAITKRAQAGLFGYSSAPKELNSTIAKYCSRKYNWQISEDWIVYTNSVVAGMVATILSTTKKNQTVAVPKPVYPPFFEIPKKLQRKVQNISYEIKNGRLLPKFNEENRLNDTQLFMFCHPHNPGGTMFTRDELVNIAKIASENNVVICSDEIHADLILLPNRQHIPIASLTYNEVGENFAQNTITLMSPNKTYNFPSIGMGYAIIPNPQIRVKFQEICEPWKHFNVLSLEAMFAALEESDEWLVETINKIRANLELCQNWAKNFPDKVNLIVPQSSFLVWIKINSQLNFNEFSLENHFAKYGVGIQDGRIYGSTDFIRLNIGTQADILAEALNRMSKAIEAL